MPTALEDLFQKIAEERAAQPTTNINGDSTMSYAPNDAEYKEFQSWKEQRIRQEARQEAQAEATTRNVAAETEADAAALRVLEAKGLMLKDAFGRTSTARGRNVAAILHKSDQGKPQSAKTYVRLRTIAARQGLVI